MIRRAQPWLGTLVEITAAGALAPDAARRPGAEQQADAGQRAVSLAFQEVALVQRLMSFHDPGSDVSRLNRAPPGAAVAVHPHTFEVLRLAQAVTAASGGIFNIACAPRLVAWGCLPTPANASPGHSLAGEAPAYQPGLAVLACESDGMVRKLAPGWIDLGGIAKGYAVDLALASLSANGVTSACVNAGGDLRVAGATAFPVTIRDPRDPRRCGARVTLRDEAMATSASYFSAKVWDGRQVCALIDGRSGAALPGAASVSVRAARCAVADALTKVVLASGDVHHPALRDFAASALII